MLGSLFSLSDIHIDVVDTADKYMKAVLINAKNRYYKMLRKLERNGVTIFELEKYETNLACEETGFALIDNEKFFVGSETITLEKSELTEALMTLTPTQLDILLKTVLLKIPQEEIAAQYDVSKRMIQKHKRTALDKLKRRLTNETQTQSSHSAKQKAGVKYN